MNELLLFLGFDRMTRSFFQFVVDGSTDYRDGSAIRSFQELERGIERHIVLALLRFGNVKHAFKVLSRDAEVLRAQLELLQQIPTDRFKTRHNPIRAIDPINAQDTYFLGYLIERELEDRLKRNPSDKDAKVQEKHRKGVVEVGKRNQDAYLASDHLDVYVATSMRTTNVLLPAARR